MGLVKATRDEIAPQSKAETERTIYCNELLDEFLESGMDVARVDGHEEHGTPIQIVNNLRYRIKKRHVEGVKVVSRKGRIYLAREE